MQFTLARVIGPAIGGVAMAAWGAVACFALNAFSFLPSIVAYMMLTTPPIRGARHARQGSMAEMRPGFAFVTSRNALLILTFLAFVGTFLGMPMLTLFPVVAKVFFGGGPKTYSQLLVAYGLGSVLGALFVAASSDHPRKAQLALILQLGFAALLVAFAFTRNLIIALLVIPFIGAGMMLQSACANTILQTVVDEGLRGRVMAFYSMAVLGAMPIGSLLSGILADRIGAQNTIIAGAVVCIAAAIYFGFRRPALAALIRPIYVERGILEAIPETTPLSSRV